MGVSGYIAIGVVILLFVLSVISTVSFNIKAEKRERERRKIFDEKSNDAKEKNGSDDSGSPPHPLWHSSEVS